MRGALLISLLLSACTGDGGIKVLNSDPSATVTQPTEGASFVEGRAIELQGLVGDENHDADQLTVTWRLDGITVCGPELAGAQGDTRCEVLPDAGVHEAKLLVQDPDGAVGSSAVIFMVEPNSAPEAVVTAPEQGEVLVEGEVVRFEGQVGDAEDAVEDLTVWWTSSVQDLSLLEVTVDSDGTVSAAGMLVAGQHALRLNVEDAGGKSSSASVVVTVEPANTGPSCRIDDPSDDAVFDIEDGVAVHATVDDADQEPDSLAVAWSSDRDGAVGSSTPDSYGDVAAILDLSLGDHTLTMTVSDDEGATCTDNVQLSVDSAPAVEILSPEDGAVVQQEDDTPVQVSAIDETDREQDLVVAWRSDLDGELGADSPDSDGDLGFTLSGLSAGTHRLTVSATDTVGLVGTESIELVVNAAPGAPSVTISPENPYTDDALVATATGGGDPDGGAVSYAYSWTVDGAASGYTASTVPASATTKGQLWAVRVVAVDPDGGESSAAADAVTVLNTAPTVGTPAISPTSPTTDRDLSCTPGATSDLDGDAVSLAYTWEIDGVLVGATGATLDSSATSKGQVVRCSVTPSDDEESGTTAWSAAVTVQNSAPVTTTPSVSPSSPSTDDDLVCTEGTTTDADGDTVTLSYGWQIDGSSIGVTSPTLDARYTERGDVVRCSITPRDDEDSGATVWSSNVSVANTLPVVDSVSISPTDPLTADALTCSATGSDADGDTVTLSYRWEVGGTTVGTGSSLAAAATDKDDDVFCIVTPSDGVASGAEVSASVTIGDTPPTLSSLSISPSAPTVTSTLTANAVGTDADGDSVSFTYAWTVEGASAGTTSSLSGAFVKGETVAVTVTPVADSLAGSSDSTSVVIQNTPPTAPVVSISPDEPYAGVDPLTCSIDTASTDADGDSISYAVAWTVNGSAAGISGYTVSYDETTPGDLWVCAVTPSDDEDAGASASASVTVRGDPVDYAHIQYPCSVSTTVGADVDVYGEVYELGVTEGSGQGPGIEAEVGYGPTDVDPSDDPDAWTWFEAIYNTDADGLTSGDLSNDEYFGILTAPSTAGTYAYAFRFTTDGGASWVYADLGDYCGGVGTTDGFDLADAGPMTVSD